LIDHPPGPLPLRDFRQGPVDWNRHVLVQMNEQGGRYE
jgi:hypothetical protein